MTSQELQAALEAIIYAADEPATLDQLSNALALEKSEVRSALDLLVASHAADERGIEVRKVAGGWKLYTKAQHHDVVRKFIKSLLAKRLITTAGRKDVIGRPILYRTSKQFLMRFGLSDLEELPSLKEFEQLAQAALGDDAGIAPNEPEAAAEPRQEHAAAPSSAESQPAADASPESSAENAQSQAAPSESPTAPDGASEGEPETSRAAAQGAGNSPIRPGSSS